MRTLVATGFEDVRCEGLNELGFCPGSCNHWPSTEDEGPDLLLVRGRLLVLLGRKHSWVSVCRSPGVQCLPVVPPSPCITSFHSGDTRGE